MSDHRSRVPWHLVAARALAVVLAVAMVLVWGVTFAPLSALKAVDLPSQVTSTHEGDAGGSTYLFVGTDAGIPRAPGDIQDTPEARADMILLANVSNSGESTLISVPRDLIVTGMQEPRRLGLTMSDGPETLIEAVCSTLGVRVDHFAAIDAQGFAAVIDAIGGVQIDLEAPVRDVKADLNLNETGSVNLSGAQALALVRSRHTEQLQDGSWVKVDELEGARLRAANGSKVLHALLDRLPQGGGSQLLSIASAASAHTSVGGEFHPRELVELASGPSTSQTLPVQVFGDGPELTVTPETAPMLASYGFATDCSLP